MRSILAIIFVLSAVLFSSCDMRSGTAQEEMEKFSGTPTPTISPAPSATPIDPADVVQVDTSLTGDILTVNGFSQTKTLNCTKYNQVMLNGGSSTATVKGACRQITVNGDGHKISLDAAAAITLNGNNNVVRYSKFANGRQPLIADNGSGNTVEKVAAGALTDKPAKQKNTK